MKSLVAAMSILFLRAVPCSGLRLDDSNVGNFLSSALQGAHAGSSVVPEKVFQACIPHGATRNFTWSTHQAIEDMLQKNSTQMRLGLRKIALASLQLAKEAEVHCDREEIDGSLMLATCASRLVNATESEDQIEYDQLKSLSVDGIDIHSSVNTFISEWQEKLGDATASVTVWSEDHMKDATDLGYAFGRFIGSFSVPSGTTSAAEEVRRMFIHAYDAYMQDAFPYDDLRPLSRDGSLNFAEVGNLNLEGLGSNTYSGVALSLLESLSTLAVLGNVSEFRKAVTWLESQPRLFDQNVRVNVFEAIIRPLGALISAHMIASYTMPELCAWCYGQEHPHLDSPLLALAIDLGNRLLPAFEESPTGIPYAWVNLQSGVMKNETNETNLAGAGTNYLEFAALSRLTGDRRYEDASVRCLKQLWDMRNEHGLFGTSINMATGEWNDHRFAVGFGTDSYFEYLFKAYVFTGDPWFWSMFSKTYESILRFMRSGPWYADVNMWNGARTQEVFVSLQAFFPGLQAMIGDIVSAETSHSAFFKIWEKYEVLPESYLHQMESVHPHMKYYPLRPELIESTFWLFQATGNRYYQDVVGQKFIQGLNEHCRVETGGFAALHDVETKDKENHQQSFFLSETLKYLYLLYDDSFIHKGGHNYVFTTEGHPLPIIDEIREHPHVGEDMSNHQTGCASGDMDDLGGRCSGLDLRVCHVNDAAISGVESACHVRDQSGGSCQEASDCGVDAATCRHRKCSQHGFCYTP